jgi:uncharacterized protein YcbK (DUF882 family)
MTNNTKLSRNLTVGEIACRCGCGFRTLTQETIDTFQAIRDFVDRPITITSGCRCRARNADVGGKANSAHLTGEGLDLQVNGMTARQLGDRIKECHRAGKLPHLRYSYLITATAVHIGTDNKPRTGIWGW